MSVEWKTFVLPERVDLVADPGLPAFLRQHRAGPVRLSAAGLRRVDTLLVQYLVAAARDWATRGIDFELVDVPKAQAAILTLIGVTPDHLHWQEAA